MSHFVNKDNTKNEKNIFEISTKKGDEKKYVSCNIYFTFDFDILHRL